MPAIPRVRFSFQAKVLAPVLAFLVLLPSLTLWIINRQISGQALAEARQTLATADAVFRNSLDILGRGLITRFRGVVNEPRFRAVAQLNDARTMTAFLRDSLEEFGGEIEVITFSPQPGVMLAGARHQAHIDFDFFLRAAAGLSRDAFEGEATTGTVFVDGQPYSVVAVPVPSSDRLSIAGVLTIGLSFGSHSLEELKSLTRTDIVVFQGDHPASTTLVHDLPTDWNEGAASDPKTSAHRVMPLQVDGEHFLGLSGEYFPAAGRPGFNYLLLSSYESRLRALHNTQIMLAIVSLVGIFISAASVWFFIQRITQPLRALRDSAEAVGQGDFTRRIERFSNDECGELASTFNQMTGNLLTSRNELNRTVDTLRSTDARLRESEEQLRLTIESARDHMICTLTIDGHVQRWNAAAQRILGYTTAEAQGLAYASFFAAKDRADDLPNRLLSAATSTGREAFEGWRVRRDGTSFWADVTLSRLPDDAGFVEIARDVTPRKAEEEAILAARDAAEDSNRAKTEFIANMSHELRTPMNAIIGMSSLLLGDKLPEETHDCVSTIRSSADSLLQIIDDILDISKIEQGQLELNLQPFDLCGCVESVVDLFAVRCRERNIELAIQLGRDLPAIVVGDVVRLGQVLSNLLSNAIKFTEKGGVTLEIAADKLAEGDSCLHFSVQDTGIGIPANRMDRLFKMFSQVDASTTRRFGGTGLGLAIGKRLIDLMKGTIGIESEVGKGSRFHFSFAASCEQLSRASEFSGLEQGRFIVVGPETIVTKNLGQQLVIWGATVSYSADLKNLRPADVLVLGLSFSEQPLPVLPDVQIIQLVPFANGKKHLGDAGRIILFTPLKPRSLYAAAHKALSLRMHSPEGPQKPLLGGEFGQRNPLRILLVEDNAVNAHVAQLLLKRLGYRADWAVNGVKALEFAEHINYDVVLMDLQMPEMDGLTATRMLLEKANGVRLPYIIALTANVRKDDRDACRAAGMHDFMSKPVQLEKLANGLERAYVARTQVEDVPTSLARPLLKG